MLSRKDFRKRRINIGFRFGSIAQLILMAEDYEDIIYVMWNDIDRILFIICCQNYNVDKVLEYVYENVPYGIEYEIIVQNEWELVK